MKVDNVQLQHLRRPLQQLSNPPTPNKTETQVPLVPVTIDLGATPAANTEPFPAPVYQAHSTGPGVPASGKFYQYVQQAAAIAHCSRGSNSNPIAVDDVDISKLLQDPVATASINKVEDAFYKAHPEVAAKFQKKPLTAAAAVAAADHEQPASKVAKAAPEDSPGSIAAAAAAAVVAAAAVNNDEQNEMAAAAAADAGGAGDFAGDGTGDSCAKKQPW
ncbi:hypothetical protein OEZ85_002691 [Tetradesmus obliquus]|uniref:Uncharacterized protein n=1 Tax=Tetradesmus obliquus TaxID=3088 RepID=A0ABY8TZ45_TETOB|nr:hypothetical protein OEZ85_002691 [Tetradesmus obliquus]